MDLPDFLGNTIWRFIKSESSWGCDGTILGRWMGRHGGGWDKTGVVPDCALLNPALKPRSGDKDLVFINLSLNFGFNS